MQETLILRLPAYGTNEPIPWLVWHKSQQELIASGSLNSVDELSQLKDKAGRCEVIVALPGQDVFMTKVTLPAGTKRHLQRIIPYALEEELASDIEQLHFAWPDVKGTELPVAVVAKERMDEWLKRLSEAGIDAPYWVPDCFLLPYQEGVWQAIELGDSIIVRTGAWEGFTVEKEQFAELAPALASEQENPTEIVHYGELNWPQSPAPLTAADIEVPFTIAVQSLETGNKLNLRQGNYRSHRAKRSVELPWQAFATAASVLFVLAIVLNGVRYWQLNSQSETLKAQAEQLYRDAFPGNTRIVNLKVQLQRQLDGLGLGNSDQVSVLAVLQQLEPAFKSEPDLQLELLRFQNNELRLQATAKSFSQFESFQQAAKAEGLNIEAGSMSNRGETVSGALTVQVESGGAQS
ncbi:MULTISPECIES: type II secretion system protein GspL [Idiomarina]|jgi:general secretion pathway protein L|uniref:type II secretion system protein GspL n=1 Tax=Idiomarina TaxID=135575 RepID=UPI000C5490FD|nr:MULTISPECIES: type II secretion system protein GspL [Idiomarina]MBH93976.1 type II secretion system protein GspL [Idiomarina sp.]|tara:strand:+ start:520 stop:1740 length:1221 start_codon:yes stop_codon:yes gene_type:complete